MEFKIAARVSAHEGELTVMAESMESFTYDAELKIRLGKSTFEMKVTSYDLENMIPVLEGDQMVAALDNGFVSNVSDTITFATQEKAFLLPYHEDYISALVAVVEGMHEHVA